MQGQAPSEKMSTATTTPATGDAAILEEALKEFKAISEAESNNRVEALDDLRFAMGEQWPARIKKQRDEESRPCITINRVQQMVKQVVNDMRKNRAAIKVHPTGEGAREDTAELMSGLIRHIEAASSAADHYVSAGESAVHHGFGYFRLLTEYEPDSFDQNIRIKRIRNPFSVYYDAESKEPDGSDARRCFIIDDMPRKDFETTWPDADLSSFDSGAAGDKVAGWISQDRVRVAEYFRIEETPDTLYLLVDGTKVKRSELPKAPPAEMVLKSRPIKSKKCVWRKITALQVLETREYKTSFIPVIPVWGEEYDIEGVVHRMGIVRHSKDPQRVYNYARTAATEQIALAPKSPYIMAEGQVEGYEHLWASANTRSHAYLLYKPTSVNGQHVPPPARQAFAGVPVGSMADLNLAAEEIKAVTGIYDASLGANGNETSGKAILARQREADNATYHYVDNLNKAIRYCGRQLLELIPLIYDTQRVVRILGEDGKEELAEINAVDPLEGVRKNDLTVGKYDVVIQTGPSYETKRIEAINSMTDFMQAVPNAAPVVADLIAKNMDWPGAEAIAKRLHALLPPQVLAAETDVSKIPPAVQAHVEEMQSTLQQLSQALQELQAQNADLQNKLDTETEKQNTEKYKAATDRLQAVIPLLQPQLSPDDVRGVVQEMLAELLQPMAEPEMPPMMPQPTGEPGMLQQGVVQ